VLSHPRAMGRMPFLAAAVAAAIVALVPAVASAQTYPGKPIHVVVPFPPGGSTDLLARRIGEKLSLVWNQPVIVDNRGGAGGTIGSDFVAKAAPDGYTLLMGVTGTNAISGALYPSLPYDVVKSFVPVSLVVSAPLVLVRNPSFPAKTVPALVALLKDKPASVSYGSAGNGTSMHLTGEMFKQAARVHMVHIPYRGSAGALQDLMGGQLQLMFGDFLVVLPQLQAGKLDAVAVTSKQRNPLLPNVPRAATPASKRSRGKACSRRPARRSRSSSSCIARSARRWRAPTCRSTSVHAASPSAAARRRSFDASSRPKP